MKNIRNKVFETNSSSTHSISIASGGDGILSTILPVDGIIELTGGQFGWEWEKYNDALTKANYAAVYTRYDEKLQQMLKDVIMHHTGAKEIVLNLGEDVQFYIDHQSDVVESDHLIDAFDSADTLKNWIFNENSWLLTGNDNEDHPANFYDEKDVKYAYELILKGFDSEPISVGKLQAHYKDDLVKKMILNAASNYVDESFLVNLCPEDEDKGMLAYSQEKESAMGEKIIGRAVQDNEYLNVKTYSGFYNVDSLDKFHENKVTVFVTDLRSRDPYNGRGWHLKVLGSIDLEFEIIELNLEDKHEFYSCTFRSDSLHLPK